MAVLRLVLGDQLDHQLPVLKEADRKTDIILMLEVDAEARHVPHHRQKIVFLLSVMRHFAQSLKQKGYRVDYVKLDDPKNTGSLSSELARAAKRHKPGQVIVTEAGDWRVARMMQGWSGELGLKVDILEDPRFFCSRAFFRHWAEDRKSLRMEFFYREMRRKTGFLMEGEHPVGGKWNFDAENRKTLSGQETIPERLRFSPDAITNEVIHLVGDRFKDHFGDIEPFGWAVTRHHALQALDAFIETCLADFGDYQDAMKTGAPFLYHATLSPYLNCGLLHPREICERAEAAYGAGRAPLNAVEGFIRQILGWREFVRGLYGHFMPEYAHKNHLNARRDLPWFYWSGETRLNCLRQTVGDTRRHAYAHHIQRLMVTGNFALLAGLDPAQVARWYLAVYADAYEWVELPNVYGMALFADGGIMASKPYAASGAYIDRMSDYCGDCAYDPKIKTGPEACPLNYLYWNFLMENADRLAKNPRLAMPYRTLAAMKSDKRKTIKRDAAAFLNKHPDMNPLDTPGESGAQGMDRVNTERRHYPD